MWHTAHEAYRQSSTLSADPLELVRMLYRGAVNSVRDARRHLANQEIRERASAISKACEILLELTGSLDFERGGEIAQRLAALYDYMVRRLTEANFRQSDEPLAEVLGLLATLLEGWDAISSQGEEATEPPRAWESMPSASQEPLTSSLHAWSL